MIQTFRSLSRRTTQSPTRGDKTQRVSSFDFRVSNFESRISSLGRLALLALLLGACCGRTWAAGPASEGNVYVVLWFDTEDYILPQSDDAAKRIAEILSREGVRATFKVVGEKGRTLEQRGRRDVIEALAKHEIGYHANTHSQHPTVAEYESKLDWEEGAAEFTRRERPGFEDLRRIFGKAPTCYGQPGSSWAPQVFPALKSWGVKVYLDDAPHVGLDGKPFWYGGLLNIFNIKAGSDLRPNEDWSNLDQAKANFKTSYEELSPSGGVVSIYFHPCEFIHREFWDGVNFARGANPPPDEWQLPPMKSPQEIERDFAYLEGLVHYIKSFPNVRFITASDALGVMPDRAVGRQFSAAELREIAQQVTSDVSFQVRGDYALSASEQFALLNDYVAHTVRKEQAEPVLLRGTPYGPGLAGPELSDDANFSWSQFSRTVLDVAGFVEKNGEIPNVVWMGSKPVPPESYLVALARTTRALVDTHTLPNYVTLPPAHMAAARYVADDSPRLWDWVIFPEGFDAPELMALAKLQAWTLKPAVLAVGR
ncbi:MAG TPA: polysaccharide deacetylase family protein [Terriglobia bacterium]|nr:polysaccharide deacetylase family protein [Terriglobia bacterium]